ncbi:DNA repair protein RadC [Dyadobacter jejuensis]|uniref:DNA repair protein RadC n=1 Tax=Dyadobacter jejuensis TaxID=1082580 RepID=A0A316AJB9_9BACT|nr:DNA repair protein RadC [Dyadobacter jejuensis]PWJ57408.1 DNA repair protein RadC [Dyadobacter jejuensis]
MDDDYPNSRNILSWAEEDRPREKLLLKGRTALSEAELIAILLGSGTKEHSAVDVAKTLMVSVGNNLHRLAKLSVKELMKIKGIGEARAITIVAALELGRRRSESESVGRHKLSESKQVYNHMKPYLLDKVMEEFWVILLNRANEVLQTHQVSIGGVAGTVADTRMIFKLAIENLASSVILVHNHPSGQLSASNADLNVTKQIAHAGKIIDIPVLDHVIFTETGYYSFRDEGLL